MAKKSKTKKRAKVAYPGMMGDGTEEQNLGQRGNPEGAHKEEGSDGSLRQATLQEIAPASRIDRPFAG